MLEVELKARLSNMAAVEKNVASFAEFVRVVDKADEYWHGPEWRFARGTKGFRLRMDADKAFVTFKHKRNEGGIEINNETEFEVSDAAAFTALVERVGCERYYKKRKHGTAYTYQACSIELLTVADIGDFIEIECLIEASSSDDPQKIATAQGLVRAILSMAGVSESDIEGRSYSDLLFAASK